jgi:hypothetical protein
LHAAAMRRGRTGPSAAPAPVSHIQQSDAVLLPSLDALNIASGETATVVSDAGEDASVVSDTGEDASVVPDTGEDASVGSDAGEDASVAVVAVDATDVLGQHSGLQSLVKQQYFNTKTCSITEENLNRHLLIICHGP